MTAGRLRCMKTCLHSMAFFLLLTLCCVLLAAFIISCGRRGDPVAVSPYEDKGAAGHSESVSPEGEEKESALAGTAEEESNAVQPQAPKGLAAVFAGNKVILVWDEVEGQGVKFYRVYRSEGEGFSFIGETVTPVFNDRNISYGVHYFYEVSAVGLSEGGRSDFVAVDAGGD